MSNEETSTEITSNMNRRRFLKLVAATAVGGAGVAALGWQYPSPLSAAPNDPNTTAGPNGTKKLDSFNYRGQKLEVVQVPDGLRSIDSGLDGEVLALNGVVLSPHVFAKIESGYSSHMYPFQIFRNARDLGKKLVDGDGSLYILGADTGHGAHK